MATTLRDVIRPGTSRGLDFVIIDELRKRTGVNPDSVLKFALAEMLCNALDKDSTEIKIDIQVDEKFCTLMVSDNGSKKLTLKEIKLILDFENKASSKRGFLRVSRGYLGNALKCIFGYSYALAKSKGLPPPDIIVKSANREHRIALKPDRVKGIIKSVITSKRRKDDGFTTFVVKVPADYVDHAPYPTHHPSSPSVLEDLISATSMVNPTRKICYKFVDHEIRIRDKRVFGWAEKSKQIRQETSVLWYTEKQFESLFKDFVRARPNTKLKEFIALFRGFTSKKVIREILQKLNCSVNHDSQVNSSVQFFPSTPIKDMPRRVVSKLFAIMKAQAKPIGKRSIPSVLGVVGKDAFERIREQNGWERLKYVVMKGVKVECPEYYLHSPVKSCCNLDHVEFPYLIELAVFDRKGDDQEGLKVYQCVNFMASMEDIFAKFFNINYRLGRVGITKDTPVTVVVHLVCPVLKWLNYGKSGLDE